LIARTFFASHSIGNKIYQSTFLGTEDEYANLLCDCGEKFSIKLTNHVKNSGNYMCRTCYARRDASNFDEEWGYKSAIKRIKRDAKRGGRDFDIPYEQFKKLCQQECHYCGSPPSNAMIYRGKNSFTTRHFFYSGLDRLDNNVGYYMSNVVPCCIICNRAKNSMTYKDFISWINQLVRTRSGKET